jgi:hypothetical protein
LTLHCVGTHAFLCNFVIAESGDVETQSLRGV